MWTANCNLIERIICCNIGVRRFLTLELQFVFWTDMKAFFVLFGFFCLHWSFVVDGAPSIKRLDLGDKVSGSILSITTLAPTVTSTPLAAVVNNATVNSTGFNSNITSYSDQKHKILLVVLSDVNVRHLKDPQQGKLLLLLYIIIKKTIKTFKNAFTIGQSPTISNNADNNSLNETLKIDATMLKEILKSKCFTF